MSDNNEDVNIILVLTKDAALVLDEVLSLFKTMEWKAAIQPAPISLKCRNVDFAGLLVRADVLSQDGGADFRIWLPHNHVLLAIDFPENKRIGF